MSLHLYCYNNPIHNFIKEHHNGNWKEYMNWKIKYKPITNKIGTWFLKCKYDPSYKYCKDRLNKEYDMFYS